MSGKPVFIHISKNAGTSIIASAGNHIVSAGHQTAAQWVHKNGSTAPIFCVIRNPYGRVYSEYRYRRKRYLSGEANPHLANLNRSFDDWVAATYRDGEYCTETFFHKTGVAFNKANMIGGRLIWFIPQTSWLQDENRKLLATDTLRYETLSTDWDMFGRKFGFIVELKRLNTSTIGVEAASSRMKPETRDHIYKYFREDFEVFGYEQ